MPPRRGRPGTPRRGRPGARWCGRPSSRRRHPRPGRGYQLRGTDSGGRARCATRWPPVENRLEGEAPEAIGLQQGGRSASTSHGPLDSCIPWRSLPSLASGSGDDGRRPRPTPRRSPRRRGPTQGTGPRRRPGRAPRPGRAARGITWRSPPRRCTGPRRNRRFAGRGGDPPAFRDRHARRQTGGVEGGPEGRPPEQAASAEGVVGGGVEQLEHGQPGGGGQRVPRRVPAWYTGPSGATSPISSAGPPRRRR